MNYGKYSYDKIVSSPIDKEIHEYIRTLLDDVEEMVCRQSASRRQQEPTHQNVPRYRFTRYNDTRGVRCTNGQNVKIHFFDTLTYDWHGRLVTNDGVSVPLTCEDGTSHYTSQILNLAKTQHNFGRDVEYDAELLEWKLHHEHGRMYASGYLTTDDYDVGRLWETSYVDHVLFFKDRLVVVTGNFHFYTLRKDEMDRFSVKIKC